MKKFYSFLVAAVLLMGATSCQKEATADAGAADNVEFVASIAGGRTELGDGNKVMWNDSDNIRIFTQENFAGTVFNSNIEEEVTATAKFTTTKSFTASNNGYLAVYPETASTGNATCENGVWSVPVTMSGWDGNPANYPFAFEKNAFMASFSNDNQLAFKAATAILKIKNIDNSWGGEIRFTGDVLGGAATLHYNPNNAENPISYTLGSGDSSVLYNFPEQNGETIYVPIYPGSVTGFEVYGDDWQNPLVTYNKAITFEAGVIYDLDLDNAPVGGGEDDSNVSPWKLFDYNTGDEFQMSIDENGYHVAKNVTFSEGGYYLMKDWMNMLCVMGDVVLNTWMEVSEGMNMLPVPIEYADIYMTADCSMLCIVPAGENLPALPVKTVSPWVLSTGMQDVTMYVDDNGYHYAKNVPAGSWWIFPENKETMHGLAVETAEAGTWYKATSYADGALSIWLEEPMNVYLSPEADYVCLLWPGMTLPELPEPEPELLQIKVYNKVGWSEVNCYAWDPSVAGANYLAAWPGTAMTKEGDWYVYTLDEKYRGKQLSFIFNDGTNQTHNLEFVYMDDTRHFRVDAAKTAVAITPENKEAKPGVTIYVKNSANWNPLKIYSWNDSDQTQSGSWSGMQMTQTEVINGVTYYKYAFNNYDNTKGLHVILNNGSNQTNNIDVGKFGEPMFINVKGNRSHEVIADPRH